MWLFAVKLLNIICFKNSTFPVLYVISRAITKALQTDTLLFCDTLLPHVRGQVGKNLFCNLQAKSQQNETNEIQMNQVNFIYHLALNVYDNFPQNNVKLL